MYNIFDSTIISKIDIDKTSQNGKAICELYQPLVEKRLKQAKNTPFNSTSFVMFSGDKKGSNSSDLKLIERLSWIDDQTANYIRNVLKIQKKDKTIGEFLKWKCFYGLTDREISDKLNKDERTVRRYKARAYYQLAVYSNQVEFIYEKTYIFKMIK